MKKNIKIIMLTSIIFIIAVTIISGNNHNKNITVTTPDSQNLEFSSYVETENEAKLAVAPTQDCSAKYSLAEKNLSVKYKKDIEEGGVIYLNEYGFSKKLNSCLFNYKIARLETPSTVSIFVINTGQNYLSCPSSSININPGGEEISFMFACQKDLSDKYKELTI